MVIRQDDATRRRIEDALKDTNGQIREANMKRNNLISETKIVDDKLANLYKVKEDLESCLDM